MLLGDVARINVDFYTENDSGDMVLADPDSIEVTVYDSGNTEVDSDTLTDENNRISKGKYYYQWTANNTGTFRFEFEATFPDTTQTVEYYIHVMLPEEKDTSGDVLGSDYELEFSGVVDNVFGDVDHIAEFFPDASQVQILDILYRLSKDVMTLDLPEPENNPDVYDYVKLAALCELSRIYNPIMGGEDTSLSLGDFSISTSRGGSNNLNSATASTWCEMALVARKELFGAKEQRFVKGGKVDNPMPSRELDRAFYWR